MENIDFKSGEILYDEFHVDFSKTFSEQLDSLTEDLLQVKYGKGYLLDMGWYPEYEPDGRFVVQLIKSENWDEPEYRWNCRSQEELKEILEFAINLACE
ncbi:MAG: hypothetical protein QM793_04785 [Muricomes sp.]